MCIGVQMDHVGILSGSVGLKRAKSPAPDARATWFIFRLKKWIPEMMVMELMFMTMGAIVGWINGGKVSKELVIGELAGMVFIMGIILIIGRIEGEVSGANMEMVKYLLLGFLPMRVVRWVRERQVEVFLKRKRVEILGTCRSWGTEGIRKCLLFRQL